MNKNKFHDTHGKIQHSEKVFRANLIIVNYLLRNEHFCEICRIYRIHHLKILLEVWLERTTLKEGSSNSLKFSSDESPWKFENLITIFLKIKKIFSFWSKYFIEIIYVWGTLCCTNTSKTFQRKGYKLLLQGDCLLKHDFSYKESFDVFRKIFSMTWGNRLSWLSNMENPV